MVIKYITLNKNKVFLFFSSFMGTSILNTILFYII